MSDCQLCCAVSHPEIRQGPRGYHKPGMDSRPAMQQIAVEKAMKLDRNSQIGGQPLKLVRDAIRRRNGYVSVEGLVERLQQNWWNTFVEDLFERGVIDRSSRNDARRNFD